MRLVGKGMLVGLVTLLVAGTAAEQAGAASHQAYAVAQAHKLGYALTPSNVQPSLACPPAARGQAECTAIRVPTAAMRKRGELESLAAPNLSKGATPALEGGGAEGGWGPSELRSAYGQSETGGSEQTVAIVDAYNDPSAESDLQKYREKYKLYYKGAETACTEANSCFTKMNQTGETRPAEWPKPSVGWTWEISLDLDMVSAICPQCKILLVEATSATDENLDAAENEAVLKGGTVVSNSWGGEEYEAETTADSKYFSHPGVPILVAAGDYGYGVEYPAASPDVIAVGGTALRKDAGTRGWSEGVWPGSGSGCSVYEAKPSWQSGAGCSHRIDNDVAAVASLETPVSVYDSYEEPGWLLFGGTSVATPIMAGVEAHSSKAMREEGAKAFYKTPSKLFDVSVGSNGACTPPAEEEYLCTAKLGYDAPTGNGTPGLVRNGQPVVSARASGITAFEANLEGNIEAEGAETHYHFEYGPTTSYGERAPETEATGSGRVSVNIRNLGPEHLYHYRLVATNSKGTTYGEDHTFSSHGPHWASTPSYVTSFGEKGSGEGQFDAPEGLAVNPINNEVAVADSANDRVEIFNQEDKLEHVFGTKGTGNGQFEQPVAVTFDSKGHVWVADYLNNRVEEFTESGAWLKTIGVEGSLKLERPTGVAVDAKGDIWVADARHERIVEYNGKGESITSFGTIGRPDGVAISKEHVWVLGETNYEEVYVTENNLKGETIRSFGGGEEYEGGHLEGALSISVDANGNLWIPECYLGTGSQFSRVAVFSEMGQYEQQFSQLGSGGNEMRCPYSAVVDPRGYVWVGDEGNSRIDKWKVESQWAPTYDATISGVNQWREAGGIAADGEGNVWVADHQDAIVVEFNAKHEAVRAFGSHGEGPGEMSGPTQLALDSKDDVWVADTDLNRIDEFNATGGFVKSVGTKGSGNGQLSDPEGMAIDAQGNVWVADTGNSRVEEFNEKGEFVKVVGKKGTGAGELEKPDDLAFAPNGNVYVSDRENNKVVAFSPADKAGEFVLEFGKSGSGNGEFKHPYGITVDGDNRVWVMDTGNYRIEGFTAQGEYITQTGGKGSGDGQMYAWEPDGLTTDGHGHLWLAGGSSAQEWTVPGAYYSAAFGSKGTGNSQFEHPSDVAVDSAGNLWVLDQKNHRVEEFNSKEEFLQAFGSAGTGNGQLGAASALTVDAKGNVWVADTHNNRVEEFNSKGEFVKVFGSPGTGSGKFIEPAGIAVDEHGDVWVADTDNNRIQEFNEAGEFIKIVGPKSKERGHLEDPDGVAIAANGNVWVVDLAGKVEEFNEEGELLQEFGSVGAGSGQLNQPSGIAIDGDGTILVNDNGNDRIEGFTEAGAYLFQFGAPGTAAGQMTLGSPSGLASDGKGNVWITDANNNRIEHWTELEW